MNQGVLRTEEFLCRGGVTAYATMVAKVWDNLVTTNGIRGGLARMETHTERISKRSDEGEKVGR